MVLDTSYVSFLSGVIVVPIMKSGVL
jgi:hypothetical protein